MQHASQGTKRYTPRYFLVGSWDDWQSFSELKVAKQGDASFTARIEVRQPPSVEEFQILLDGNWETRFCPSAEGSKILGPSDCHGANWIISLPRRCVWLEVIWEIRSSSIVSRNLQWRFFDNEGNELERKIKKPSFENAVDVPKESYFLVGSWDSWKEFYELKWGSVDQTFSTCILSQNDTEEFQIVVARNLKQRFYPDRSGGINGPDSTQGQNWKVKVQENSKFLRIVWDPRGKKRLTWNCLTGQQHHLEAAEEFASMLLQMRSESAGGVGFLDGMKQIFSTFSVCQRLSPYGKKAEPDATARCLLATLTRDVETLLDKDGPAPSFQRLALVALLKHCEGDLASKSGPLDFESSLGGDWMKAAIPEDPQSIRELTLFQRLVYLPLVMYVRNTVHLYEMLDRMKAQSRQLTCGGRLRPVLDGVGTMVQSPYSWLIYGVVGALQTLYRARDLAVKGHLELLASSPPHTVWQEHEASGFAQKSNTAPRRAKVDNCQPMQAIGTFSKGSGLMFRGIWLPKDIGEDALRYQYSFQSFSRCVEGVMRVLRFYSDVAKTKANEAAEAGRLLIYVARAWPSNEWVTPVQLFDGPKKKALDSEEELLLPPFMIYEFEEDSNIDPDTYMAEMQDRVEMIEESWNVELPLNLKQFIFQLLPNLNHTRACSAGVNLSVRFIKTMAPAPPVAKLFKENSNYLYEWKALNTES